MQEPIAAVAEAHAEQLVKFGAGSTGTFTFVGGTGKLAGITGGGEYTAASLRSTSAENFHGYLKAKGNYKLP